jgi:peptide-methionine (S)-S-oxide reductase
VFDPSVVSIEHLLQVFWESHNPYQPTRSRQYRKAVFHHTEEQKRLAESARRRLQEKAQRPVRTEVLPAGAFYQAEDYHQKYYLRRRPELMREFSHLTDEEFIRSTAAARANGLVAGYGDTDFLDRLEFDFSPEFRQKLEGLRAGRLGLVAE